MLLLVRRLLCFSVMFTVCYGTASRDLAQLHSDYFAWQLAEHPMSATYRGIHKYDDQLQSFRMENMDERKVKADGFYERLHTISVNDLKKDDVINYKILDNMLSTFRDGYRWRYFQNLGPVTFLEGPQTFVEYMVQGLPFFTRGDYENYIVRLTKFPKQYQEYETLMKEGIRLNRTYHRHSLDRLERQFQLLQVPPNVSAFYWPFTDTLDNSSIPEEAINNLRIRGLAAVTDVLAALNKLWEFIRDEYIPNSRPEIGISSLDGGREYYEACIRWYLSENITAQEVHDIGLREVDRIVGDMKTVMLRQGFTGTVGEYFRILMNNSNFFFETSEELINEHSHQIFDIIEPKMDSYFINNPRLPLEVRPTPTDGPAGYYSGGSADGTRPGIFWLNTFRPSDFANFTMMALSIHETNPGHHLQSSIAILSDTPDFRQKMLSSSRYRVPFGFPGYTAYVEGWALYSEFLGEEMGLYRDDYELMGRYSSEIFRACRLVVDTGIHAFNWTRERSIDYFLNYTADTYDAIAVEIDRYITWPGQAVAYKIGEIRIKELRAKAEQTLGYVIYGTMGTEQQQQHLQHPAYRVTNRLREAGLRARLSWGRVNGDRFDIREFHSVILESGTLPLSVLEDVVNDWLDSYALTTPTPDSTTAVTSGTVSLCRVNLWLFLFPVAAVIE